MAGARTTTASVLVVFVGCVIGSLAESQFPAMIVFGDSIVDTGNNNYLLTVGKCNFPPYGRDFKGHKATGRFSNGKVPSDLIAETLGVKQLIPPYLDPSLKSEDLLTGVSFASGASGYDPISAKIATVLSLTDQLSLFEDYKEKLVAAAGKKKKDAIISKSFYLIAAGSNDLTNTYYLTRIRQLDNDIDSYTDLMVSYASAFFKDLYKLGARHMGILSAPPAGCLPSQRTVAGGLTRACVGEYNEAAQLYNSKLASAIQSLNSTLPGAKLLYLDIYTPLLDIIMNPSKEGFEVVDRGCCGTGNIEVSVLCNWYDLGTCADASKYVFWDSFHPSQHTYEVLVRKLFGNKSIF